MVGGSEPAVGPTDGGAGRDVGSGFDGVGTDEFAGAGAGACADACAVSMCSWVPGSGSCSCALLAPGPC